MFLSGFTDTLLVIADTALSSETYPVARAKAPRIAVLTIGDMRDPSPRAAAIPPALILVDRTAARRDFPLLAGFENRLEMSRWEFRDCAGRRIADSADDGRRVLEVTVTRTADFPMLALADGLGDWAGYRALTFVAWVPGGQPIELHARLDLPGERLRTQRRCRTSVPLSPGTNHVELPLSDWIRAASPATPLRPRRLTLYLRHGTAGTLFWLDDLRLVP